jgi:hypothetical protein
VGIVTFPRKRLVKSCTRRLRGNAPHQAHLSEPLEVGLPDLPESSDVMNSFVLSDGWPVNIT